MKAFQSGCYLEVRLLAVYILQSDILLITQYRLGYSTQIDECCSTLCLDAVDQVDD